MATSNPVNGTLIALYIDETGTLRKVANLRSNDFDFSVDMIEVSSKSSAGAKEYIAGDSGGSFTFEGIFEEDGSVGTSDRSFADLFTLAQAKSAFTAVMTSNVTGDVKYSASVLLSNLKLTAPYNDAATFSGTCQITGAITPGTI